MVRGCPTHPKPQSPPARFESFKSIPMHLLLRWLSPTLSTTAADAVLAALRVFTGLAMAFGHGLRKVPPKPGFIERTADMGFPAPEAFAWAAGLAELVGGILLAIGLFTRPSAFFIVVTMLVAAFLRHGADPFSEKELALLYGFAAAYFMVRGSGRYGLDAWLSTGRT